MTIFRTCSSDERRKIRAHLFEVLKESDVQIEFGENKIVITLEPCSAGNIVPVKTRERGQWSGRGKKVRHLLPVMNMARMVQEQASSA